MQISTFTWNIFLREVDVIFNAQIAHSSYENWPRGQDSIYINPLTLSLPERPHWRVKSSGVSQSRIRLVKSSRGESCHSMVKISLS